MSTPRHADHGGGYYSRGRAGTTRFLDIRSVSLRCRDCGKLTYRSTLELSRAARARCLACGGTLIETEASERERLGTKTERDSRNAAVDRAIERSRTLPKCYSCGETFARAEGLADHLAARHGCAADYVRDGQLRHVDVDGTSHQVVWDTLRVGRDYLTRDTYVVEAFGRPVVQPPVPLKRLVVERFRLKRDAAARLANLTLPASEPENVPPLPSGFTDGDGI